MKHFIKGDIKEFEIDGDKFSLKDIISDDEIEWRPHFMETKKETKDDEEIEYQVFNRGKYDKCRFLNLIEVPFTQEEIKDMIQIDKEFKNLNTLQKLKLFGKLNPTLFGLMNTEINKLQVQSKND